MTTVIGTDVHLQRWLAEAAWELFQAGGVGLYEFADILNGSDQPSSVAALTAAEKQDVAHGALLLLLATGDYHLRWTVWATDGAEPASIEDVTSSAWHTPPDRRYLALEQVDGVTRRLL